MAYGKAGLIVLS